MLEKAIFVFALLDWVIGLIISQKVNSQFVDQEAVLWDFPFSWHHPYSPSK
jgi:hypothetical protein